MRPLNIFHIDDSDEDALLLSRALRRSQDPTALKWFPSAREAVGFLEAAPAVESPDLIFCALKMPGMTGHDFVRWLRQSSWQAVPVIVLSSAEPIEELRAAYELGASSFLIKPLAAEEILKVLNGSIKPSLNARSPRTDGGCHTWSDDDEFWNWFEKVTDNAT